MAKAQRNWVGKRRGLHRWWGGGHLEINLKRRQKFDRRKHGAPLEKNGTRENKEGEGRKLEVADWEDATRCLKCESSRVSCSCSEGHWKVPFHRGDLECRETTQVCDAYFPAIWWYHWPSGPSQEILATNDHRDQRWKTILQVFTLKPRGEARTWFCDLKPRSIPSFDELSEAFISQYFCNRKRK